MRLHNIIFKDNDLNLSYQVLLLGRNVIDKLFYILPPTPPSNRKCLPTQ